MVRGFFGYAASLAVVAVAGCGGGSSGVSEPKPVQPISAVLSPWNKAIADQSCDEVERLTFSQLRQNTAPGAPATASECQRIKKAMTATKDWRYNRTAEYGTAALMEGQLPKPPPKGAPPHGVIAALFILDRDRRFRNVLFLPSDPQIGTKPHPRADDHGRNARAFVDAVRARDCKKAAPLISPQSTFARGQSIQAACEGAILHGKIFAPAVRATKDAEPKLLGATRDLQFYGVSTKATYFTLVMSTPPGTSDKPPLLIDLFANTSNAGIPKRQ